MKISQNLILKSLWTLTFILSLLGLSYYIREIYIKWHFNPDILTNEKLIPSSEIPMPAITICSPLAVKTQKINDYEVHNLVVYYRLHENKECYKVLVQTCRLELAQVFFPRANEGVDTNFDMSMELYENCSLKFNEFIYKCTGSNCMKVMTNYGFCYSINLMENNYNKNVQKVLEKMPNYSNKFGNKNQEEWSLSDGYKNESCDFPIRAAVGNSFKFEMILKVEDEPNICGTNAFIFYIHKPNEIPTVFHEENFVQQETSKNIYVTAKYLTADVSLRKYKPEERRCYFEGEKKLKFFSSYTKNLCEFECLTNYTFEACGCIRYSMPRINDTKICNMIQSQCMLDAFNHLDVSPCACLDSCVDIKYSIKFEKSGEFDYLRKANYQYELMKRDNVTVTSVELKFFNHQIVNEEKFVSYKLQNFISDCGGLIGLFLGMSLLSIVDVVQIVFNFLARTRQRKIEKKQNLQRSKILILDLNSVRKNNFEVSH